MHDVENVGENTWAVDVLGEAALYKAMIPYQETVFVNPFFFRNSTKV